MGAREVTATEFARNLSSLLNEVRYQGVSLEVRRGKEAVAHVVPPPSRPGFPIERLNHLMATLPRLDKADAEAFLEDLAVLDRTLVQSGAVWDS
jgi:antitoxin (DNA-binding transcriptional repressor) of toxin-antitoxin stability system